MLRPFVSCNVHIYWQRMVFMDAIIEQLNSYIALLRSTNMCNTIYL